MEDAVAELVRRAHGGEVLGVELFTHLAARETDPQRKHRLLAARLLEEQTAAAAAALADDLGVTVDDGEDDREAGRRAAQLLGSMDWPSCMQAVADATGSYRALYSELEQRLDAGDHPAVAALLSHERALHSFAVAEAGGEPDALGHLVQALDPVHRDRLATPEA